jgi:hypothetical protein
MENSNISIVKTIHPQSLKEVDGIKILDKTFIYRDNRGHSAYALIDSEFAIRIIAQIPAKVFHAERLNCEDCEIKLSWICIGSNSYELKIHVSGQHVYTSDYTHI